MDDTAVRIARRTREGAQSAVDTVRTTLDRIAARDGAINAFRETWAEDALRAAEIVDRRVAAGEDPGPLAGVPIAVKDNIATRAGTTACGSRMLDGYRSPYDATAVRRITDAGGIVIGKTNCDEFAMGSSTEHCAFRPTRNPWDTTRVPGGSSGGSAAAVAAGFCPLALGSDTGGSIRQPAALCGVVGLKPSYGRVSRYGLVAFGSSLDQIGPFARTVEDAALLLGVIAGADRHDSTSADVQVPDYAAGLDDATANGPLQVGVAAEHRSDRNHPAVNAVIEAAIDVFRAEGAEIVDVALPLTEHAVATYYVIAPAEASSNLARYDGIRYGHRATAAAPSSASEDDLFALYAQSRAEGFGPEVRRRIMLGTYALSAGYYDAYYRRAQQVRRLIAHELDAAFATCDVILGPTSPVPAFRLGERSDPLMMYQCDVYTTTTNIAGICAISLPGGHAEIDGVQLPIGVQLQCPAFAEATLLPIAHRFERATKHHAARPAMATADGAPPS